MNEAALKVCDMPPERRLNLGFAGVGWIGQNRLSALVDSGLMSAPALFDPSPVMIEQARERAPGASIANSYRHLLEMGLDGIVIATPNALHAEQAMAALSTGHAVFCQKPLARNADETRRIIETARDEDRLLAVDFCYRQTAGMIALHELLTQGRLGHIFAIDLTFHNAYGPDKAWFYDRTRSGGGCVIDLGVHLVDLALWLLDFPQVIDVQSHLLSGGLRLEPASEKVEDFAVATLELGSGAIARLACSWRLHAGRDAEIRVLVHGTEGGVCFHNVKGSFLEFALEQFTGTSSITLAAQPDEWGGRAAIRWARQLARGARFDVSCLQLQAVADTVDAIYMANGSEREPNAAGTVISA